MDTPHIVDRNTGELLEYNSPLVVSLSANTVTSIIRSLVAQEESLTKDLDKALDYIDDQNDELSNAYLKMDMLEEMLDDAHDRMECLQEELNLSSDNFYKVASETYTDFYQLEHEHQDLTKALHEAQAQIKSLQNLVEVEQEMNDYLSDEIDSLLTELSRVEHYAYSGQYSYDPHMNIFDADDIPPSAFIVDDEGYMIDDVTHYVDEDREVEFYV